ncbi:ABC transporter ATP-binding protein [Vineibacter terrae]|uniref:ABC transporter ATP-binding protein n=1 Tax=Vineibacter terrae TaxID=2586908 RepID=UPI002E2EF026|nr:ABC transporter ATP-binding protein [Vineibacter terrae]HEX2890330.1 ABC transporter ATP-binding protein [Vineibacter terrae]
MLEVKTVSAGYGALTVLRDVSLHVEDGEAVALVGANGAGKTTLVRTICGLQRAHSGSIAKNGADISAMPAHELVRHGLAVVLENRRLFGELTVRENLRLAQTVGRRVRAGRMRFSWDEVTTLFPVVQERMDSAVELLSGGQQQMVAIARALLLQPDLLIMDEPSTGLAPKVVKDILLVIKALRDRGMGLLLIEQNVGIAAEITDRAYVMAVGSIVHEIGRGEWQSFLDNELLVKAYLG